MLLETCSFKEVTNIGDDVHVRQNLDDYFYWKIKILKSPDKRTKMLINKVLVYFFYKPKPKATTPSTD